VNEDRRPYLVHLRLLQEWLTCGLRQPLPSDTVAAETAFDLAAAAGASPHFSRADHTHGTPLDPIPPHVAETHAHDAHEVGGDVTGSLASSTVGRLRHVPIKYDADGPEAGEVLTFVSTPGPVPPFSPKGNWQPVKPTLPPHDHTLDGDVGGTVGATVVEALRGVPVATTGPTNGQVLTFTGGQWTPATASGGGGPSPAGSVTAETAFGQAPAAGSATAYSRADHTHGTPPDPIPPHIANVTAHGGHGVGGDLAGTIGAATVRRLQGVPMDQTKPTAGQVLTCFVEGVPPAQKIRWAPANPQGGGGGAFVERSAGSYFIVAAGTLPCESTPGDTYNGLFAKVIGDGQVFMAFAGYKLDDKSHYIVKALVAANQDERKLMELSGPVVLFDRFMNDGFVLFVMDRGSPVLQGRLRQLRLMIEVSQYVL
jgi:hypothetical protein